MCTNVYILSADLRARVIITGPYITHCARFSCFGVRVCCLHKVTGYTRIMYMTNHTHTRTRISDTVIQDDSPIIKYASSIFLLQ